MQTYTSRQVAEMTGKQAQAVTSWAKRNGLGVKHGRDWFFTEAEVRKIAMVKPGPKRKPWMLTKTIEHAKPLAQPEQWTDASEGSCL